MTTNLPALPDVHLFATHPAELEGAQAELTAWMRAKEHEAKADLDDCRQNLAIAQRSKWSIAPWKRRVAKAGKVLLSYKKLRMALEAGYYIIPPMPFTAFAIRTKRHGPTPYESEYKWDRREQRPQALEPGEGRYVSPDPIDSSYAERYVDKDGKEQIRKTYWAKWFDEVEFPVVAVKPQVLDAASKAMALGLFDEIGLLERRGCGDPIVAARILRPNRDPVTFFVGWWLDTREL